MTRRLPALRALAVTCLWAAATTYGNALGGVLELHVRDDHGAQLPCRITVRGSDDRSVVPDDAVTIRLGPDIWFMSTGYCELQLPAGAATVRIERGHEYERLRHRIHVGRGRTVQSYRLRRWIDMRQHGYLCGENHLHVDAERLGPMLVAEGLDFGSVLTWWRGPDRQRPIPAGTGHERALTFAGRSVPTSVHDAELEYAWGAAYVQNLPAPLPLVADRGRPNLDYLKHAVDAGAIVHYQGGWSREVLVDALMGYVHTINVCNNNFAPHRFQPRSHYSNLLSVVNLPVYPNTDVGMLQMNTESYYRLLNCGLRLAAGAGSATGVKEAPPGYNRAYVRVGPTDSLADFYEAWKAGRNFVTNGPMLLLRTERGQRPGDVIQLPAGGGTLKVRVDALSNDPLTAVEIVINGRVVRSFDVTGAKNVSHASTINVERGSWIAATATSLDELLDTRELLRYADHRDQRNPRFAPSRLRFAHTSPIYVTVGGRGTAVKTSIDECRRMLAQFERFAATNIDARFGASLATAVQHADVRLRELAELSRQHAN